MERPVARWVPIGVHGRLRSRLARCPVAFSYAAVLTRKPASNRLLITSCFLSGRRSFCEIRAAKEMIRAKFSSDRGSRVVVVLDPPDNTRSVAHQWASNKASCYPANTVIVPCAHNGIRRRPTRFEHICSSRNARRRPLIPRANLDLTPVVHRYSIINRPQWIDS